MTTFDKLQGLGLAVAAGYVVIAVVAAIVYATWVLVAPSVKRWRAGRVQERRALERVTDFFRLLATVLISLGLAFGAARPASPVPGIVRFVVAGGAGFVGVSAGFAVLEREFMRTRSGDRRAR